jgi:HlyD family secretion protein
VAKPGQQVHAGDLLLQLDDHALRLVVEGLHDQLSQEAARITGLGQDLAQKNQQVQASIELLELDQRAARAKWTRYQQLRDTGAISAENLLAAELNVQRIEIQLRQQHEQIEGNRRASQSAIEGARLQKSIFENQLQQQEQLLAQTEVRAPFTGVLTAVMVEEGASVATGQQLVRVSDLSHYQVEASLSDFHAQSLAVGQLVRVVHDGAPLGGHVHTVLPEIQNGTVKLIVELDRPSDPILRNKLRVDVAIVAEHRSDTLVIDQGPALNGQGPQSLFVVRDSVARRASITIGACDGRSAEVRAGATAGDQIIISDMRSYRDLDSIRISH